MKRRISFSVEEEEYQNIEAYAKAKGLKNGSGLARFSTYQYMARYPLKDKKQIAKNSPFLSGNDGSK